ncbi:MAG: hypothetical protein F4X14_03890 [Caldilineaceae bacterium SB0661_bin_32]|uniref:DUF4276 family protein n=1 Tax=Caldilineaceae bacterium SB0661_bin_32 TaxID=2605255 RepID=A0A6B1D2M8_9CHLR|nr:hypothetical protein [Caldilineaceae bacterium SB0661_bin_32]
MDELRYTLVAEGSSDAALLPILNWLLIQNGVRCPIQGERADVGALPLPIRPKLTDKISASLDFYPCDLLFIHRDSDRYTREKRTQEICKAISDLPEELSPVFVCVIPVRMQEAWLLIDEAAIKSAAGNRRYAGQLNLPPLNRLERIPDAKEVLNGLLRQASDLNRRRQRRFPVAKRVRLVAEFIEDFTPLRQLSAFVALEEEVRSAIQANNWDL